MAIYRFKKYKPIIAKSCYLAPGAQIIGNVDLSQSSSIWYNCVLRGDVNKISVGEESNIQDLSMLHVTEKNPLLIANNVTIGHSVTLHGCTIERNCLIGMGATILDDAIISEYSIVAAGSLVTPGKKFPSYSMIMGAPAKVVRKLNKSEIDMLNLHYKRYVGYANDFKNEINVSEIPLEDSFN